MGPTLDLTLTGTFPARVRATEQSTLQGTVTLTNATSRRIEALSASRPDVTLTQDGTVVATPLPRDDVGLVLDLAPGATRDFIATGSLPLSPGHYELHAALRVGDATLVGGPWPLEVA